MWVNVMSSVAMEIGVCVCVRVRENTKWLLLHLKSVWSRNFPYFPPLWPIQTVNRSLKCGSRSSASFTADVSRRGIWSLWSRAASQIHIPLITFLWPIPHHWLPVPPQFVHEPSTGQRSRCFVYCVDPCPCKWLEFHTYIRFVALRRQTQKLSHE